MNYVAIINTAGYLPETEPVVFATASEAWQYLADELQRDENRAYVPVDVTDPDGPANQSPALHALEANAANSDHHTGTVYVPSCDNYAGDVDCQNGKCHHQDYAYSVDWTDEDIPED